MKIKFVIAAALMVSLSAYAQKDELKALKKLDSKFEKLQAPPAAADVQEYKKLLDTAEATIGSATTEQQAEFYYYKGGYAMLQMMTNPSNPVQAFMDMKANYDKVIELEKSGKKKYTKEIQEETYPEIKQQVLNAAEAISKQGTKESYAAASKYFYAAYELVPSDHSMLYNAAAMAVNGGDYNNALKYYLELDKTPWTGEGKVFTAVNKKSGQVEPFPNEGSRDIAIKTGDYNTPSVQEYKSQKPEIARNIALLYLELGQEAKAKEAMANARKLNPDDVGLIISEANIYINAKDYDGAKRLINEAIAKQPNNADLFMSLGNLSAATDAKAAEDYYKKAIAIKPDNFDAYARLGDLTLQDEQKMTDQMNALGNSAADNKKFAELKAKKDANYKAALGYYEKAYNIQKDDQYIIGMLTSLYQALEMEAKYQEFKAKQQ
jgi:Tfp pilus assembly protein PilF